MFILPGVFLLEISLHPLVILGRIDIQPAARVLRDHIADFRVQRAERAAQSVVAGIGDQGVEQSRVDQRRMQALGARAGKDDIPAALFHLVHEALKHLRLDGGHIAREQEAGVKRARAADRVETDGKGGEHLRLLEGVVPKEVCVVPFKSCDDLFAPFSDHNKQVRDSRFGEHVGCVGYHRGSVDRQ